MAKSSNPPPAAADLRNPKHRAVAEAFVRDPARIGWRAYKAVFPGSSEHAAQTSWSRLMKNAGFTAYLDQLKSAAADAAVMDLREVLAEQSKIGRADVRQFKELLAGGDVVKALAAMPPELTAAIQEFSLHSVVVGRGKNRKAVVALKKFKLHSKASALAELRAHHEPTRHEHTGRDGKPIETRDAQPLNELEIARRIHFLLTKAARGPAPAKKG